MYVIFFFTRTENKHSNSSFLRSSKSRLSLSFASLFCNFETCAKIQNFSCFVISAVSILFFLIFFCKLQKISIFSHDIIFLLSNVLIYTSMIAHIARFAHHSRKILIIIRRKNFRFFEIGWGSQGGGGGRKNEQSVDVCNFFL
eukprot:11465.XXX_408886_409314_1 [CDS] Oithona nana genome sequencing.